MGKKKNAPTPAVQQSDSHQCGGHCCQKFFLPFSPTELHEAYKVWHDNHERPTMSMEAAPRPKLYSDIWLIYPMVIPLGHFEEPPIRQIVPVHGSGYWYSCKNWDPKTKLCTIYDDRPAMCRDYPYQQGCNYQACGWDERRKTPPPKDDVIVSPQTITVDGGKRKLGQGMSALLGLKKPA